MVNATFRMAPWADVLYAADFRFWDVYADEIFPNFHGEMWSVSEQARQKFGLYWMRHVQGAGFCNEPDSLMGGGNSGHQAIHLAGTFGAKKIILLGFDMQQTDGKAHWHGKHKGGLPNGKGFIAWAVAIRKLVRDLGMRGVDVVNCTRTTALKTVRRSNLQFELP